MGRRFERRPFVFALKEPQLLASEISSAPATQMNDRPIFYRRKIYRRAPR